MIYAPVIIPTLSRYDHLKTCIESLNKCHNAENTVVYISIDFPPSVKYREGHKKICEYLDSQQFRFKELHIIKQTTNLGVINDGSKKYGNLSFLIDLVKEKYDRWILSEDDNYFAPGFLDFVNEGLEKFKDDSTVFSICGYSFYYNIKTQNNNFYRQQSDFNAWGAGFWKDKFKEIPQIEVDYIKKILYNPFRVYKIWRVSNMQISHLVGLSYRECFKKADNFYTLYMIDHGMTQIMPAKSLVRNFGWDGSGLHCVNFDDEVTYRHINQEIDNSPTFSGLKGSGWEYFLENKKVIRNEDFQRVSFKYVFMVYIIRLICFWK